MPELPEVETIRQGLRPLVGKCIAGVDWRPARLRSESPRDLHDLLGRRIVRFDRHGKHLLVRLDDGATLLVHLGMTGKLLLARPGAPERAHTHLVLRFDDVDLQFSDPRRFGGLQLFAGDVEGLDHYGPDALAAEFTAAYLAQELSASRSPLKAFLLDQTKVAGVGNIYACEALWRACLSPRRRANRTPKRKVMLLHAAIGEVLREAIGRGGTSFNDYVDAIGQKGQFVADLAVFQREGSPCPRCGKEIRRIVQGARSTFYCPSCQK